METRKLAAIALAISLLMGCADDEETEAPDEVETSIVDDGVYWTEEDGYVDPGQNLGDDPTAAKSKIKKRKTK